MAMQKTVIIVDDSFYMLELLQDFFSKTLDFQVLATGQNGMQAVSLFKQHQPDLMTMDLTMPVKDGKTALEEILVDFPKAKILIITSQIGPAIVECLKSGAAGYIEKPLEFDSQEFVREFTQSVNQALTPIKN